MKSNFIFRTVGYGLLLGLALSWGEPASAIHVRCLEASKYKYLYEIFGNDKAKFAEFLQVSPAALPDGEICRAGLLSGPIEMAVKSPRDAPDTDYNKLLEFIERNKGWLSKLYLGSSGGNVKVGLTLAQLTRLFWLKTTTIDGDNFLYRPDFIFAAPMSQTWIALTKMVSAKKAKCASACTFIHFAGIDRQGTAYVHRGRFSNDSGLSMTQMLDLNSEDKILALYRQMDAGDNAIRLFQDTTTHAVAPVVVGRFPRYVADYLRGKCGADAVSANDPQAVERDNIERCIVAAHEKERLAQFATYCRQGCDHKAIDVAVKAKLSLLAPPTAAASPAPTRK